MTSQEKLVRIGEVLESLPSLQFRIRLVEDGHEILGYLGGKMRLHRIRILPGDTVRVELNSDKDDRGRIVYREK
ncbi:MAG: translation initiation factor IF-1 [bacterium]|nr:translation initiation factor IF-1 [bacterium]